MHFTLKFIKVLPIHSSICVVTAIKHSWVAQGVYMRFLPYKFLAKKKKRKEKEQTL